MYVNQAEDDIYRRLKDSGTPEEKNVILRQHRSCYHNRTSKGSHCRKYDGKEADNLPGSCKGMCSFSRRTKPNIFDQNSRILQIFKQTKRCDPCKNFDPLKCRKTLRNPH